MRTIGPAAAAYLCVCVCGIGLLSGALLFFLSLFLTSEKKWFVRLAAIESPCQQLFFFFLFLSLFISLPFFFYSSLSSGFIHTQIDTYKNMRLYKDRRRRLYVPMTRISTCPRVIP